MALTNEMKHALSVLFRMVAASMLMMSLAITADAQQPSIDVIVSYWLNLLDTDGDSALLPQQLADAGDSATPALIAAAQAGPDQSVLQLMAARRGMIFDEIRAKLAAGDNLGLSPEQVSALQSMSKQQTISNDISNYVSNYKERALYGLAVVGTDASLNALRQFAADSSNPAVQEIAQEALNWKLSASKIAPTVTFTGAPTSAAYNSTFTVTATTDASTTAVITASGVCSIAGGTVTMSSGTGTCSLTATWDADDKYTSATANQSTAAAKADSATTITANTPNPSTVGQAVAVNFKVVGSASPTGSATVTSVTGESCSGTLTSGVGGCSLSFASAGARTLTAAYTGDGNFNGSTSAGVTQTVSAASSLTISPSSVNFGNVYLGLPAFQTVTLKNTGSGSITITSVAPSKSGNDPDDFIALNLCPAKLAAGKSCTILVTFTADGDNYSPSGTLIITDSAAGSPQTVPLSGTVINPKASLSAYSMNFGKQKVGTTSAAQAVTLTNTGTTALSLSALNIGGDFSFATGTTCTSGETLLAGASCLISVNFTPTAKGARLGNVTIKDNALLKQQIIVLNGTGN